MKKFVWFAIVSASLQILVPSERTMTLIAASEVSQKVIETKAVQDVGQKVIGPTIDLLNSYIERETANIKKEIENSRKSDKRD